MEKVIILGTGNAGVKNCYNTCFALKNKNEYLLVDAGGGNGILKQLELAKIELSQITNMIVTHSHTDHVLGVVWIFRMVATKIKSGEYDGNFNIYCHDELVSTIKTIIKLTVQERLYNLIDERIFINEVQDGQKITICEHLVTFFDIYSTKAKQFGFSIELDDGKLTCLGDEPFNELCYQYAVDSKWLLSEAFCLYQERDFFKPYEKHHSTVREASELAQILNIKNLILYHTLMKQSNILMEISLCLMIWKNIGCRRSNMTLDKLIPGMSGKVTIVHGEGLLRRRLLEMGLTPKTVVKVRKIAPMGDPIELYLRSYVLTIRKDDAAMIEVEVISDAN